MNQELNCILLIDDDEATNFVHEYVIKQSKIATHVEVRNTAASGLEYIKSVEAGRHTPEAPQPGIIFLDINMPGMNGWEFLEEYQKLPKEKKAEILVVMLTTSLNPDDHDRAKNNSDISCFLNKPLSEEKLKELIKNHYQN